MDKSVRWPAAPRRAGAMAVLALLAACCAACAGAGGHGKKLIRLCHSLKADTASCDLHFAAETFRQYVGGHSRTLEVKIHAAGVLGDERSVYEAMQIGSGPSCCISGSAMLNNFCPRTSVIDLPYLWRDYDHVHRVLDGPVGDALALEIEQRGFKFLAWMDSWGYRNIVTTRSRVSHPSDLRGLKIRTIQTPVYVGGIIALGANATPMAGGEVYSSLQTGILDGFEHNPSMVLSGRFFEVTKHLTLTRHFFGPVAFTYSRKQWDLLMPGEQRVVIEGARAAQAAQRALAPLRERESLLELEKAGMTITGIDTDELERRALAFQDKVAAECGAEDLLRQIRAARGQ